MTPSASAIFSASSWMAARTFGGEPGGGDEHLDALAVGLHGLDDRPSRRLPERRARHQRGQLAAHRHALLDHQRGARREQLGDQLRRGVEPHAAAVVAAAHGLQHRRSAERDQVVRRGDLGEPRPGDAERRQPSAHHELVLRVHERVRPGVHGDALGDQRPQVLLRHLLVVERHGRAAARERPQRRQVRRRARPHVRRDLRSRLVGGCREHPQRLPERDRGLVRHAGELACRRSCQQRVRPRCREPTDVIQRRPGLARLTE